MKAATKDQVNRGVEAADEFFAAVYAVEHDSPEAVYQTAIAFLIQASMLRGVEFESILAATGWSIGTIVGQAIHQDRAARSGLLTVPLMIAKSVGAGAAAAERMCRDGDL